VTEKRGRPSDYTAELAAEICRQLADGNTLRRVCRDDGMPSEATVRGWAMEDRDGFSAQYARAREIGYHAMADEALDISDDGTNDTYLDEDGNRRTDQDVIARSRLRVDTRKWLLSKALPKVYGDKLELAGDPKNPIHHKVAADAAFAELVGALDGAARAKTGGTGG
jgi:hypothetical protein